MAEGGSIVDIEWSCPSCTFINKPGSFKCFVCGTPKGTATRQMKFQYSALEQQYVAESLQTNRAQTTRSLKFQLQQHALPSSMPHISAPNASLSQSSAFSSNNSGSVISTDVIKKKHRVRINPLATTIPPSTSYMLSRTQHKSKWPRLRNIDRTRIIHSEKITVNNVTVTITEYPFLYPDSE